MREWYQYLPQDISPIAFSIGPFSIGWYALMWLAAFSVVYALLLWRIKKGEGTYTKEFLKDLLFYSLLGALIGGRLGYVLFYDLGFFLAHPIMTISPYDFVNGRWTGIFGMSYHGGIVGVAIGLWWIVQKNNVKNGLLVCKRGEKPFSIFLRLADFIVPAIPLGYFFGRIGNFLNGELFGRVTNVTWGMYVDSLTFLRHPSQLYEAFFEGIVLFALLWPLRNRNHFPGFFVVFYICGYALIRFVLEFFRQPDVHLGFVFGALTLGQILSVVMFFCGTLLFFAQKKKHKKCIDTLFICV